MFHIKLNFLLFDLLTFSYCKAQYEIWFKFLHTNHFTHCNRLSVPKQRQAAGPIYINQSIHVQTSDQAGRQTYKPIDNKCKQAFGRHWPNHLTSEGYFNPMRQEFQHIQEKLQDTMDHRVGMDQMMSCPDSLKAVPPKWNRPFRFSCKLSNWGFHREKMQERDKLQHHKTSHTERNLTMPCHAALWACLYKPSIFSCKLLTATNIRNTQKQAHPHQDLSRRPAFKTFLLKAGYKKPIG